MHLLAGGGGWPSRAKVGARVGGCGDTCKEVGARASARLRGGGGSAQG